MANVAKDVADIDMAKFRLPSFAPGSSTSRNERVAGVPNFDGHVNGKTRMLIVALDYQNATSLLSAGCPFTTSSPLTCTIEAKHIEDLAKQCGLQDISNALGKTVDQRQNTGDVTCLYNENATKEKVLAAIDKVGQSCGRDDFFVFYFAGHGVQVKDTNGDEDDGLDEAFLLVDPHGQVNKETLLIDDDFSDALYNAVDPRTRIMILTDCGLDVADLGGRKWTGRKAISISGFSDLDMTSTAGIFTHAMLLGIDKIGSFGLYNPKDPQGHLGIDNLYSIGMVYNAALMEDATVFASKQDLTIQCTAGASPDQIPWPLIPPPGYEAPLRQHAMGNPGPVGDGPAPADERGGIQAMFTACRCQTAHAMLGTAGPRASKLVLEHANLREVLVEAAPNYVKMTQGTDLLLKVSRSCHSEKCVVS